MDVIKALKDPDYRRTLSAAEQARLDHPVGPVELTDADLGMGGAMGLQSLEVCTTTDLCLVQDQMEFCTWSCQCECY